MAASPRISLDQWRALIAVVDAGGYAQAATAVHRSQSAVSYAVQKIERVLGVTVFELRGRKAHLTDSGRVLYQRAKALVDEAGRLERAAGGLAAGWEPELRLAVEIVFPTWLLLECFDAFAREQPDTRIELYESVIGGTEELLTGGQVDLALSPRVPPGYAGDPIMTARFVYAAHPAHPLHLLGRPLTPTDLRRHRQLVIRESGSQRKNELSVSADQRWTVSHKATSIAAACRGLGFARFPEESIRGELERGELAVLPMREGAVAYAQLYLVFADPDGAGPGARRLAALIRERVAAWRPPEDAP